SAAESITAAAFFNAGQDCTAASRVIVHERVHDELVAALVKAAEATKVGPEEEEPFCGPLNNTRQFEAVMAKIDGLPTHATVCTGGRRIGVRGFYFAPTVVTDVRQDDAIVQQETFGPVLTVQRFDDEHEAVRLGNGVPYGLAASVWTRDNSRAQR